MLVYESLTAGQADKAAVRRGPLHGIFTGSWGHLQWTTRSPAHCAHPSGVCSKASYKQNSFLPPKPRVHFNKGKQVPVPSSRSSKITTGFKPYGAFFPYNFKTQPFLPIHRRNSRCNPPSHHFMTQSLPPFGIWPDRFRLKLNPPFCWPSLCL